MIDMHVNMGSLEFRNPVIGASGAVGFGEELSEYIDWSIIGGISSKGVTFIPKEGNSGVRIWECSSGIMNSIGLENPGVQGFVDRYLDKMLALDTTVLANLGGNTIDDYVAGAKILDATKVHGIELNISCPNVKHGGMAFGIVCSSAEEVVSKVRAVTKKPLIVKLSPNAESIVEMAKTAEACGADGVSLVNTFNALAIDIYRRRAVFDNVTAGLSGPCIKPIALRMVRDVSKAVNIPVSGIGGIVSWEDAVEFIMAGATTVQVGLGNLINPTCMAEIVNGIAAYMEKQGIKNLSEIRGII